MSQLPLPLGFPEAEQDVFIVGDSNAQAVHQLDHWGIWPVMAGLLTGPRKSGRSTLARYFAAKTGGTMIDDAERAPEAAIFHAWNEAQAARKPLLIVADFAPPQWQVRLPDLRSRLAATPHLTIGPPDDRLIADLFRHFFTRMRLDARPELIDWLSRRVERSHVALLRVADALEGAALARRNMRLSIPLARTTLTAAGLLVEPRSEDR